MESAFTTVPLFRELPATERAILDKVSKQRQVRKGVILFREQQPAQVVWILTRGWVSLTKVTPTASTDCQLVTIPAPAFIQPRPHRTARPR